MKIGHYSNKNIPRKQFFKVSLFDNCIVFMFKMFDLYIFWGDDGADLDYDNK